MSEVSKNILILTSLLMIMYVNCMDAYTVLPQIKANLINTGSHVVVRVKRTVQHSALLVISCLHNSPPASQIINST